MTTEPIVSSRAGDLPQDLHVHEGGCGHEPAGHAQGEGCSSERLVSCSRHESFAGEEAEKTPCGSACPSTQARADAMRAWIAEANAEAEAQRKRGEKPWRLHRRWDRAARLLGETSMERLARSSVTIFGLGGVGSFAAEGLVRSGVGRLVLVDFDEVCVTNVNRQLHAMKGAYNRPKCEEMAERCRRINPEAEIVPIKAFYNKDTSEALLEDEPDFVVDAIDSMTAKLHLIATCHARGIPVVSSMGAAGKLDPTQIKVADLAQTHGDPMAREVRKYLRKNHGIGVDTKQDMGVLAVYSAEARTWPQELSYDALSNGFLCVCPSKANEQYTCDSRNLIDGSASFVTSVFGMVAASVVVRKLTDHDVALG